LKKIKETGTLEIFVREILEVCNYFVYNFNKYPAKLLFLINYFFCE